MCAALFRPGTGIAPVPTRFGIHHLRTTRIGQALSRIFEALGYEVIKICYLGDWGTQFGQVIAAYKRWGDPGRVQQNPMRELLDLYIQFRREAQADSALEEEGRAWFRRLEMGDPEATALWQQFRDWSVRDLKRVYSRMGTTCQVIRNGLRLLGLAAPEEM